MDKCKAQYHCFYDQTIEFTIYGFYSKDERVYQMMGIRIKAAYPRIYFLREKNKYFFHGLFFIQL